MFTADEITESKVLALVTQLAKPTVSLDALRAAVGLEHGNMLRMRLNELVRKGLVFRHSDDTSYYWTKATADEVNSLNVGALHKRVPKTHVLPASKAMALQADEVKPAAASSPIEVPSLKTQKPAGVLRHTATGEIAILLRHLYTIDPERWFHASHLYELLRVLRTKASTQKYAALRVNLRQFSAGTDTIPAYVHRQAMRLDGVEYTSAEKPTAFRWSNEYSSATVNDGFLGKPDLVIAKLKKHLAQLDEATLHAPPHLQYSPEGREAARLRRDELGAAQAALSPVPPPLAVEPPDDETSDDDFIDADEDSVDEKPAAQNVEPDADEDTSPQVPDSEEIESMPVTQLEELDAKIKQEIFDRKTTAKKLDPSLRDERQVMTAQFLAREVVDETPARARKDWTPAPPQSEFYSAQQPRGSEVIGAQLRSAGVPREIIEDVTAQLAKSKGTDTFYACIDTDGQLYTVQNGRRTTLTKAHTDRIIDLLGPLYVAKKALP